jgi:hypothetical protein
MKCKLFILIILFTFFSNAQQWQWAKTIYGSGSHPVLEVDNSGNTYFAASIDDLDGVVLGKYNAIGNMLWQHVVKTKRGMSVYCNSIKCEVDGNAYYILTYRDTLTIDNKQYLPSLVFSGVYF